MNINTKNLVSITEANQNFSRVARLVDENGAAVILKNNVRTRSIPMCAFYELIIYLTGGYLS